MKPIAAITVLGATCALLILPSLANARPVGRTFAKTYPVASKLCAKADADTLGEKLADSRTEVLAACATLKASFAASQTAYKTATDPLPARAKAALVAAKAACGETGDETGEPTTACREARAAARKELRAVRTELRVATKTYITAIQAGRKTFWTTIKSLGGGDAVPTDTSTGTGAATPAAPAIPSDDAVAA